MNDQVVTPAPMPKFKPDYKKILDEVKLVASDPVGCWSSVRGTFGSVKDYYVNFLFPLALISAVVTILRTMFYGQFLIGIVIAVLSLALYLVMTGVTAFVMGKVAAKFGGTDDFLSALKLIGYAGSLGSVACVITLVPFLGALLMLLVWVYTVYIFYQGISPMLSVPAEKRIVFFLVMIAVAIVLGLILFAISAAIITPIVMAIS